MTDRVSEEEAEIAIRSIDYEHSAERLNYWKSAQEVRKLFRALLSERAALEARLAEAKRELFNLLHHPERAEGSRLKRDSIT